MLKQGLGLDRVSSSGSRAYWAEHCSQCDMNEQDLVTDVRS